MDEEGKRHGETDPKGTHEQGLFERNPAALAAYDREVKNQQKEDCGIKDDPEPDVHAMGVSVTAQSCRS